MRRPKRKSRSKRRRDRERQRRWQLKRLEKKRLLAEAYWDKHNAELIATESYVSYGAEKGDVLFDSKGYNHSGLEKTLERSFRDTEAC